MEYKVKITELLEKVVSVNATNIPMALQIEKEDYFKEKYVLDADDCSCRKFEVYQEEVA